MEGKKTPGAQAKYMNLLSNGSTVITPVYIKDTTCLRYSTSTATHPLGGKTRRWRSLDQVLQIRLYVLHHHITSLSIIR